MENSNYTNVLKNRFSTVSQRNSPEKNLALPNIKQSKDLLSNSRQRLSNRSMLNNANPINNLELKNKSNSNPNIALTPGVCHYNPNHKLTLCKPPTYAVQREVRFKWLYNFSKYNPPLSHIQNINTKLNRGVYEFSLIIDIV